jgi:hypothetical protein
MRSLCVDLVGNCIMGDLAGVLRVVVGDLVGASALLGGRVRIGGLVGEKRVGTSGGRVGAIVGGRMGAIRGAKKMAMV